MNKKKSLPLRQGCKNAENCEHCHACPEAGSVIDANGNGNRNSVWIRGNHLSDTACLTPAFLEIGEQCSKFILQTKNS